MDPPGSQPAGHLVPPSARGTEQTAVSPGPHQTVHPPLWTRDASVREVSPVGLWTPFPLGVGLRAVAHGTLEPPGPAHTLHLQHIV